MGSEFIPKPRRGRHVVQATRPPSISLSESIKTTLWIEKTLRKFPEVIQVVSRTGAPEVATDPYGMEISPYLCKLKTKGRVANVPRTRKSWSQKVKNI